MKGVIDKGIQEMVKTKFGAESWEKVKSLAGCDEPFFALSMDYPDELTNKLIAAAAEVSGLPAEEVMVAFGKFIILNTIRKDYPVLFELAGASPREFLLAVSKMHEMVTKNIPNSRPPRIDIEEPADGKLLLHYHSDRSLCPMLLGIILGVGEQFDQKLEVTEIACARKGDPHCTMEVIFI